MTMDISIQVHGVSKQFDEKVVLKALLWLYRKPKFSDCLGPSGSGKTTLVRMIAGIDVPTSGPFMCSGSRCHS